MIPKVRSTLRAHTVQAKKTISYTVRAAEQKSAHEMGSEFASTKTRKKTESGSNKTKKKKKKNTEFSSNQTRKTTELSSNQTRKKTEFGSDKRRGRRRNSDALGLGRRCRRWRCN